MAKNLEINNYWLSFSNRYMNWKRFYSLICAFKKELEKRNFSDRLIKVLDLGCWDGRFIYLLKENFSKKFKIEFYGVDLSLQDIDLANKKKEVLGYEDCHFQVMDVEGLNFGDNEFDIVICSEVIEHLCQPQLLIRQIYRVLKKGGLCLLTTPQKGGGVLAKILKLLRDKRKIKESKKEYISGVGYPHISIKSEKEWRDLFIKEGFKIQSLRGTGGLLFGGPELDNHRILFSLTVILDVILEKLPFSHLWSEILFFELRK